MHFCLLVFTSVLLLFCYFSFVLESTKSRGDACRQTEPAVHHSNGPVGVSDGCQMQRRHAVHVGNDPNLQHEVNHYVGDAHLGFIGTRLRI